MTVTQVPVGVVKHSHRDSRVEPGEQGRLNRLCPACKLVSETDAKYGDFAFLEFGGASMKRLHSNYVLQDRVRSRINATQ